MNGRIVLRVLFVVVVLAAVAGVGVYAYNLGVAQGLAGSASLAAPGVEPHLYYGRPFFFGPFGFGFAGCLFPLLFVFLALVLLRGLFWHGHWAHGRHGSHWERGVPPMFEEWHRQAHEPQQPQPADK